MTPTPWSPTARERHATGREAATALLAYQLNGREDRRELRLLAITHPHTSLRLAAIEHQSTAVRVDIRQRLPYPKVRRVGQYRCVVVVLRQAEPVTKVTDVLSKRPLRIMRAPIHGPCARFEEETQ